MKDEAEYPAVVDPELVGTYSGLAKAGGGFVWDEVLEYRVWCCPANGAEDCDDGDDYYDAFGSYPEALAFSRETKGAGKPLALVRQIEHINEPKPGEYVHVKEERVTEWSVEFLRRPRRTEETLAKFFAPDAPANRLDILRGKAK